jgi:uncharacterized protein YegL
MLSRLWVLLGALAVILVACTNADLERVPPAQQVLHDKFTVTGEFCTGIPDPAEFPVRILFIVDVSGSMSISDPPIMGCGLPVCLSRRGLAVEQTLKKYPPGDGIAYGLITFSSTASILTTYPDGLSGFTTDANQVLTKLPTFDDVMGQTSYDSALSLAYTMLQADMNNLGTTERGRARYEIVFMSDGAPDPDNTGPGESLPPDVRMDVLNIESLQTSQQLALVSLNTVYINAADTPANEEFQASTLLSTMANLANGQFRQVNANESINLFYIDFTTIVRQYALKTFIVSNLTERAIAAPGGGGTVPGTDTDGDGLDDATEALIGTSPLLTDTDGDGFSDFLEYQYRNSGLDPLYPDDANCSESTDRLDTDGDGLLNCEERFIGTSLQLNDTDTDGYSDDIEYHNGTNPVIVDNLGDYDFDSAQNGFELHNHTDPQRNDAADFSQIAYQYDVGELYTDAGTTGQACYQFTVTNITLAPALSGVPGTEPGGTNTIMLHVISAPSDNYNDPGTHQIACIRPKYQTTPELTTPASAQMNVPRTAFKTPGLTAGKGVGFDPDRDCIVP